MKCTKIVRLIGKNQKVITIPKKININPNDFLIFEENNNEIKITHQKNG